MTILGLAESFKTMNQPDPTRLGQTATLFDGLSQEHYKRLTHSSFMSSFCVIKFRINIFDRLETMRFLAT